MSTRTVLVGHDGSRSARHAVAWALEYAVATGARVQLLRAWAMSTAPRPASMQGGYVPPIEDFEAAVVAQLRAEVAPVVADCGPDVEIEYLAYHGSAGEALVRASDSVDLIVVGSRGTVTDQCLKRSACPVVVVRGEVQASKD